MLNVIKSKKLTWVDIKGPTEEDIIWLKDNYKLHPLVLKELLPELDYPKIENFGDYLFIVFFYPFFDRETNQTIPFELDVIIAKDYIITNHYKDIVPLKAIFDQCNLYEDIKEEFTDEGPGELLYRILKQLLIACLPKLSHIKQNIDEIEQAIFKEKYQETVYRVSLVKRDLIGFQRIVEPQAFVLQNLAKEAGPFFGKKFMPYFRDLININSQVSNLLQSRQSTLNSLDNTNQSLLSNHTNEIIRLLTIFSVIVFPLTLLAAIFGMNTKYLPLVGRQHDFWLIMGVMLFGAFIMLGIFKKKKWL